MEPNTVPKENKLRDEFGNTARSPIEDLQDDFIVAQQRYLGHPDGSAEKAQARHDLIFLEGAIRYCWAGGNTHLALCYASQPRFVDMF